MALENHKVLIGSINTVIDEDPVLGPNGTAVITKINSLIDELNHLLSQLVDLTSDQSIGGRKSFDNDLSVLGSLTASNISGINTGDEIRASLATEGLVKTYTNSTDPVVYRKEDCDSIFIPNDSKGIPNGVAPLDSHSLIPLPLIPGIPYERLTNVPSEFNPSNHNQPWSTITGVPSPIEQVGRLPAQEGSFITWFNGEISNVNLGTAAFSSVSDFAPFNTSINLGTGLDGGGFISSDISISLSAGTVSSLLKADTALQSVDIVNKADLVNGVVPTSQLPSIAIQEYLGNVEDEMELVLLSGQKGDWATLRNGVNGSGTWILVENGGSSLSDWVELSVPASKIQSVNGQGGPNIVLGPSDIGSEPYIVQTNASDYYGGDKAFHPLNKSSVGLSNVLNVNQTNASNITSGTLHYDRLPDSVKASLALADTSTQSDASSLTSGFLDYERLPPSVKASLALADSSTQSDASDLTTGTLHYERLPVSVKASLALADTSLQTGTTDISQLNGISPYALTLIDDVDDVEARTTLGATSVGADLFTASSVSAARSALDIELHKFILCDPISQELTDWDVSTAGELITLSGVPNNKRCLVLVEIEAGLPESDSTISIAVESPLTTTKTPPAHPVGSGYSTATPTIGLSWTLGARSIGGGSGIRWILTDNAQIYLRRAGSYFNSSYRTNLWVHGWFEGD